MLNSIVMTVTTEQGYRSRSRSHLDILRLCILSVAQQAYYVQELVLKTSLMQNIVTVPIGAEQKQVCLKGKLGNHQNACVAFVVKYRPNKILS